VRIRGAALEETGGRLSVTDLELDEPGREEVLVRLHASGVCHSDLNAIDGTAETRCPAVLGHEGAHPLIAVDRDPAKLELALARGATHAVEAGSATTAARVVRISEGGVEHALEVVGIPETMRLAWDVLRPGGTAVVVGLAPKGAEVSLPAIEFLSDKGIRGSYYGNGDPETDLPELAELALSGQLDLAGIVTHVEPLDAVEESLERLRRGDGVRTVLVVDPVLAGRTAA